MNRPPVIQKPAVSGNYGIGRKNRISRITFHHIVGDAPASIARFQTPGEEVSATYSIGSDGTIYQHVDENNTPYSDGSADSNSKTISIEHAGGIASVPYTDAMYAASIQLVAYLIQKYGITDFKRHREVIDTRVYPGGTLCPGQLNVERIVNSATALVKGEDMANPTYQQVLDIWREMDMGTLTEKQQNDYVAGPIENLYRDIALFKRDKVKELEAQNSSSDPKLAVLGAAIKDFVKENS